MIEKIKRSAAIVWAYVVATYLRFKTESPTYWKRIQSFLNWLTVVSLAISEWGQNLIIFLTGYGLDTPPGLEKALTYVVIAGAFARLVAGFAIDPSKISESRYEKLVDPKNLASKSLS